MGDQEVISAGRRRRCYGSNPLSGRAVPVTTAKISSKTTVVTG